MAYVPSPSGPKQTAAMPHYPDVNGNNLHQHHGEKHQNGSAAVNSQATLAEKGLGDKENVSADELARRRTVQNEVNFGFVMTMMGFSIAFAVAEVIPLFLITLFTVVAFDLAEGAHVIWLLVSQIIAVGAVVPFVGTLADLLGRKGVTLVSLVFTIVGMILIGATPNLAGFIAGQVVSGIGIGIQLLTAIAAVTELVPTHKRGITIGYVVMGFLPFAPASVYGQLLAEHSWRWVAVVIGAFALLAFVIIAIWYKPPPRVNTLGLSRREIIRRIDFVGAFLAISGVVLFLVGLNWGGQDYPWKDVHTIVTLVLGLVLMIAFGIWEFFGAKYPLFPSALIGDKKIFFSICFLCLTSGINYIPVVVFWGVQLYTVYGNDFRHAGIHLLPIGFCIAGGAIISAGAMSVFKRNIHWVLTFFCVVQTVGLGCMAAVDPDNLSTAWGPMIIGLIGVGGVLLPSQVVFSIISPDELIGTSVALSIVVRSIGQVIGISMFYNVFATTTAHNAAANLNLIAIPALGSGLTGYVDGQVNYGATIERLTKLVTTLTAGPFSRYAAEYFPELNTPEKIATIQAAASQLFRLTFPKMYLVSIAWGSAAVIVSLLLKDIRKYINEDVAVHL